MNRNLWTEIELTSWLGYRRYLLNKWVSTIKPHWKSDLLTKENSFQPGFVILIAMVTENHHFGNRHYFQGWTPRTKVAERQNISGAEAGRPRPPTPSLLMLMRNIRHIYSRSTKYKYFLACSSQSKEDFKCGKWGSDRDVNPGCA